MPPGKPQSTDTYCWLKEEVRAIRIVEHYYHLHDEEAPRLMGRIKLYDEEADGSVAASK